MRVRWFIWVCLIVSGLPAVARGQYYSDRGAVLGGVTGALAGAGIGKHNDETAAGALIGGAVGVITGAAVGQSMDNRAAQAYAAQQQAQQWRQQQLARAVSTQDVVTMTQNGVSADVMINHIRQHGVQRTLEVHDVIALHRQGVPESVIAAMQQASVGPAPPVPSAVIRQPVVVEQRHYVAPAPYWHYYRVPPPYYRLHSLSTAARATGCFLGHHGAQLTPRELTALS